MNDRLVVGVEGVVGADEEGAGAAGRVAHGHALEGFETGRPVGQQLLRVLVPTGLRIDPAFYLQSLEPLPDERVDGALHDQARERGRRVVDAEALPLGALGHLGGGRFSSPARAWRSSPFVWPGRRRCRSASSAAGLQGEEAAHAEFFQFRDRALEQVPQDLDVDFLGEVVSCRIRRRRWSISRLPVPGRLIAASSANRPPLKPWRLPLCPGALVDWR